MNKISKVLSIILILTFISMTPISSILEIQSGITAEAHSGRTDSSGGHKDNKNKSGLGSYHYHCGGNPAHLHTDGVCPYSAKAKNGTENTGKSTTTSVKTKKTKSSTSPKLVKKVQKTLNDLGYDCGKADGVFGKKTKTALKKFQKDNGLKVDGKIGKQVKKALNIT